MTYATATMMVQESQSVMEVLITGIMASWGITPRQHRAPGKRREIFSSCRWRNPEESLARTHD